MKVVFHPEFPNDVRRFAGEYAKISDGLSDRFISEVDSALSAIKAAPTSSGHFLNLGSTVVKDFRRKNLKTFPFFILYGLTADRLIFGSIIPSRADPLTWLIRFETND